MASVGRLKPASGKAEWAVLTPLGPEWQAVCSSLENVADIDDSPLPVRAGLVGGHQVMCVLCGKGEANSAAALQYVFERWRPRWVVLSGIAGALPESKISVGDVIIPNFIYSLDFGKVTNGKFLRRPEYDFQPDRSMLAYVDAFLARRTEWKSSIARNRPDGQSQDKTQSHICYVASSDKVIDDPNGDFFSTMRSSVPEIHAVEMEAAGIGASVRFEQGRRSIGFLMVRGISDQPARAGADGTNQRGTWKEYASAAAAAFVVNFIRSFPQAFGNGSRGNNEGWFDHRCKPCFGRGYYGAKPTDTCNICHGKGHLLVVGSRTHYERCRPCGGAGHYGRNPRSTCKVCEGFGITIRPAMAPGALKQS